MFKPDPQHKRNARLLKLATEQANASLPANHLNLTLAGRRYKGLAILIAHTFHWSLEAIGNIASESLTDANFPEVAKVVDDAIQSAIDGQPMATVERYHSLEVGYTTMVRKFNELKRENESLNKRLAKMTAEKEALEKKLYDKPITDLRGDIADLRDTECGNGDTSDITDEMLWDILPHIRYGDTGEQACHLLDQNGLADIDRLVQS